MKTNRELVCRTGGSIAWWKPIVCGLLVLAAVPRVFAQGTITTIAGTGAASYSGDGGPATSAALNNPWSLALDSAGNLFIADYANSLIRKIDGSGIITRVAGCTPLTDTKCLLAGVADGGPATAPVVFGPFSIAIDSADNLYLGDTGRNSVRKVSPDGIITTVAGGGTAKPADGVKATGAALGGPVGLAVDNAGNIYFSDITNNRVWRVDSAGTLHLAAGTGPIGFSGDGGPATSAQLSGPHGLAVDASGNLFITDTNNFRVRKVNAAGIITTVAGNGSVVFSGDGGPATSTALTSPQGLAFDSAGNLFIAETLGNRIRKVDTAGNITIVAGNGKTDFSGDGGPATQAALFAPGNIAFDRAGNLYIADTLNNRVRKVTAGSAPPPVTTQPPSISSGGVVNGASFQPGVVPNSWATILGSNFVTVTDTWNNSIVSGKLPTALDGATVTIDGKPAWLSYVSPGQINLLVPDIGVGPVSVTVTNSAGTSSIFTVNSSQYAPAFFLWPGNQVVASRQDFTFAARANTFNGLATVPAKPGDVLILWGTGFGPTSPAAPMGVQVPADRIYSTSAAPTVTINNLPATVAGAALAPGFAGLYQIAITVPSSIPDGDWPLRATIGGISSPAGTVLAIRH